MSKFWAADSDDSSSESSSDDSSSSSSSSGGGKAGGDRWVMDSDSGESTLTLERPVFGRRVRDWEIDGPEVGGGRTTPDMSEKERNEPNTFPINVCSTS